jgi:chaperonin GroES
MLKIDQIHPVNNFLLVSYTVPETKTASGLYLTPGRKEAPFDGEIISVYEGCSQFKIGDKIIFKKFGGNEVTLDRVDYLFIKPEDILAKV